MATRGVLFEGLASMLRLRGSDAGFRRTALRAAAGLGALVLCIAVSLPVHAQGGPSVGLQAAIPLLAGTQPVGPQGIAVDHSGNLFIVDFSNSRVVEVPAGCTSTSCQTVEPISSLHEPTAVAVDAAGDLFVADFGFATVWEVPAGCALSSCVVQLGTGLGEPSGVATDSAGDLFIADYGNKNIVEIPWTGTAWGTQTTVVNWLSGPFGVAFDKSNDFFIADFLGGQVVELKAGDTWSSTSQILVANLAHWGAEPKSVAVDGSGNVFVASATGRAPFLYLAAEVPAGSYGCSSGYCLTEIGYGLNSPAGIAVDASGDIFVGDYGNNRLLLVRQNSFNFGSVNVGSTSGTATAYFNFGAATSTTLNTTPYQVLTQGQTGLDFADAGGEGGNACVATAYTADSACIVNVDLTSQSPGLVTGAVTLTDNTNTRIATAYIGGTGSGPEVTFFTSSESFQGRGGGLISGRGLTVDRKGNIFVADSSNHSADEFVAASGYSPTILSTSFSGPSDVAVDGAGNVFVADTDDSKVEELLAPAYTTPNILGTGFNGPSGVAIDGAGNVFVADTKNGAVKEIVAPAYTVVNTLNNTSFKAPSAVAIDASGNLFVADSSLGTVSELTAASGYVTVTSPIIGLVQPVGLALDASGNVYVADTGGNAFDEFLAASSYAKSTLSSDFTAPSGIALDAAGNVYVTISGANQVGELELSTAPTLNFGTVSGGTTTSPQTVTVSNIGNSNLTFPVAAAFDPTTQSNGSFKLDASSTCSTNPLSLGTNCTEAIDFSPTAGQTYTGTFTLTDNNLNTPSPYAAQAINLSGTGEVLATMSTPTPPGPLTSASTTFTWNSGSGGATVYYLWVGTTPGALNLVNIGPLSGNSATVNLPTDGSTIYVRLWTVINGTTFVYNDYTYTEFP